MCALVLPNIASDTHIHPCTHTELAMFISRFDKKYSSAVAVAAVAAYIA